MLKLLYYFWPHSYRVSKWLFRCGGNELPLTSGAFNEVELQLLY
uniref:Uncharacterized protein n=1 Tax=Arundo donax TaxID=35708 RepID=A0A0A8YDX5_ARUDO